MKVFLSYSRVDKNRISTLLTDLEDSGHDVWLDADLTGGQKWWDAILEQIQKTDVFVLAATGASLDSEACLAEASYADALHKTVVPLRLEPDLAEDMAPTPLPRQHWISYLKGTKGELKSLLRAFASARREDLPDPLPAPPDLPLSYVAELRQAIDAPGEMKRVDLLVLLDRIESHSGDNENRRKLQALLSDLRDRDDMRANLIPRVNRLLDRLDRDTEDQDEDEPAVAGSITGTWLLDDEFEGGYTEGRFHLVQTGTSISGTSVTKEHSGIIRKPLMVEQSISGVIDHNSVLLRSTGHEVLSGKSLDYALDTWTGELDETGTLIFGLSNDEYGNEGSFTLTKLMEE